MSEILFIRHAETDMAGTFCGHSDPELNANGHVQLVDLVNNLRTEDIGVVYASDLRRAHSTAITIAEAFDIDCHIRYGLREIDFGQWEGLTWKEIQGRDETYARRWIAACPRLSAPGGEDFLDFKRRVLVEVKFLSTKAESQGSRIAVVTHAGVLRTVLCELHGCSEEEAWEHTKSYCSIIRHTNEALSFVKIERVVS
jgi:broad specificity phosphatase PhoE